jgi:hypothetical protein
LNALNGALSPAYFQRVLHWEFEGIGTAAILQGVLEGTLYAALAALVLGWSWMRAGGERSCAQPGRLVLPGVVAWWAGGAVVGGGLGCALAALSPEYFIATFPPADGLTGSALVAFAWVGGSIQGALAGAALGALAATARLRRQGA